MLIAVNCIQIKNLIKDINGGDDNGHNNEGCD